MAQSTQTYKRSLSGSVGAGLNSIFGNGGKTYYVLEHKVSSRYHKAGEAQEIIVDQIEIGRDSKCAVQFDESFKTVSRQHAAIVRDGQNWKLVQLSHTNKTFLNGHPVEKEWYLQNGDEIQLSVNGPKLGFIIPSGNKSTVGSIGLSRRLSLFRQQALKPYKTTMSIMAATIALLIVGGVWMGVFYNRQLNDMNAILDNYRQNLANVTKQNNELARLIAIQDSINRAMEKQNKELAKKVVSLSQNAPQNIKAMIDYAEPSVYYIVTKTYLRYGGKEEFVYSSRATGFLLSDGTFVTARHCVENWLYENITFKANALPTTYPNDFKTYSKIYAVNCRGDVLNLSSEDFVINRRLDKFVNWMADDGKEYTSRLLYYIEDPETGKALYGTTKQMSSTDWAYAKRDINGNPLPKGTLNMDGAMSENLASGVEVHALGFPAGLGVGDSKAKNEMIEPIYTSMRVARSGLNKAGMIMVSQGTAHGNSGGPVSVVKDGKFCVIGIVSQGMMETQIRDEQTGVIMEQQQQFDELVPISSVIR